jgi:hypothetical protein
MENPRSRIVVPAKRTTGFSCTFPVIFEKTAFQQKMIPSTKYKSRNGRIGIRYLAKTLPEIGFL